METLATFLSRLRSLLLTLLILVSVLWPFFNWRKFHDLQGLADHLTVISIGLAASEAAFITGALIMVAAIGTEFTGRNRLHVWFKRFRFSRTAIRHIASQAIAGPAFGFGFWLNFAGAVATSLILAISVLAFLPAVGWSILFVIGLDLIATFAWRIPLHNARKAVK